MSFLKRFFAPQHPLDPLRKAIQQRRWADALAEGEMVARQALPSDEAEELDRLLTVAGDALASFNLEEGEAILRGGDTARAREHFSLAAAQARNPDLAQKALALLSSASEGSLTAPVAPAAACCPTGCGEGHHGIRAHTTATELEARVHLDLLLGSYPKELADRYASLSGPFLNAFLLAHEGHSAEALETFELVAENERNDLFHLERGVLLARSGNGSAAKADLERALLLNPELDLAAETLVDLELAQGRVAAAENRLQAMLQKKTNLPFAFGRLAAIFAGRGDHVAALEHALRALDYGAEAETFVLAGTLLEKAGRLAEAEACLSRMSGSGCGSLNLPLAEFWLRHGQNGEKALQAFKSAWRQDPDNPRWAMRVGQAYLACGWRREGVALLHQALENPQLEQTLRAEATALLEESR